MEILPVHRALRARAAGGPGRAVDARLEQEASFATVLVREAVFAHPTLAESLNNLFVG